MNGDDGEQGSEPRIQVIGYGNPGRRDDGLGPALAEAIEALGIAGVHCEAEYQLNIEDAALLAESDIVLFIDASKEAVAPYEHWYAAPHHTITFTSHSVSPETVLAICEEHFHARPRAFVLAVRGYEFDLAEGLTPGAQENFEQALLFVESLITNWKEAYHGHHRTE